MILVYSERADLEEPLYGPSAKASKVRQVATEVLSKHGFEGRLPNNRIGFLVENSDAIIIIPKFLNQARLTQITSPLGAVQRNSELMSLFATIDSFRKRLSPSNDGWKFHDSLEATASPPFIFDIEVDQILVRLRKFLDENLRNSIENVSRELYTVRGRINFDRQFSRRGALAVPVSCDYSVAISDHPLYQFCNLFIEEMFSKFSSCFKLESILHKSIRQNIQYIGNLLAHSPVSTDPINLTESARDYLNRNEFEHWQPMVRELMAFRNRLKMNGPEQVSYSHLIQMDKIFEDIMAEVLGPCAPVKGPLQIQKSSSLLGGATWLAPVSEKSVRAEEDSNQDIEEDSRYKTRPDAIFRIVNRDKNIFKVISDFKYKENMTIRNGVAVSNFSRGDRYQLISFLLTDICTSTLKGSEERRLVVFFPASFSDGTLISSVTTPLKLKFDSAYAYPHSVSKSSVLSVQSKSPEYGQTIHIFLIPVNLDLVFDPEILRTERERLSRCLSEIS